MQTRIYLSLVVLLTALLTYSQAGCKARQRATLASDQSSIDSELEALTKVAALGLLARESVLTSSKDGALGELDQFIDGTVRIQGSELGLAGSERVNVSRVARRAAVEKLRVMWEQSTPDMQKAGTAIATKTFSACFSYQDCIETIADLSEISNYYAGYFNESSIPVYPGLFKAIDAIEGGPTLKSILVHRLMFIKTMADVYAKVGIYKSEHFGKNLQLSTSDMRELSTAVDRELAGISSLVNQGGLTALERKCNDEITAFLSKELGTDDKKTIEELAQDLAKQTSNTLAIAYSGYKGIKMYLHRLRQPDPRPWFADLDQQIASGTYSAKTLLNIMLMFSVWEEQSAYGAAWAENLTKLGSRYFSGDADRLKSIDTASSRYSFFYTKKQNFLEANKILLASSLLAQEADIATRFPAFGSIAGRMRKTFQMEADLGKLIPQDPNSEALKSKDLQDSINAKMDDITEQQFTLSCFSYFYAIRNVPTINAQGYSDLPDMKLRSVFSEASFNANDVCFSDYQGTSVAGSDWGGLSSAFASKMFRMTPEKALAFYNKTKATTGFLSPESAVVGFTQRMRTYNIWLPVKIEAAFTVASLPLLALSGGAASGITSAAGKIAGGVASKIAMNAATRAVLSRVGAAFMHYGFEVAVFSVINRLAMNAIYTGLASATGESSLLALRKSMFASYWHDMLLGSSIFYGLSRVSILATGVGTKILATVAAGGPLAARFTVCPTIRALVYTGSEIGGQSVFFLGISEVSKQIEHLLRRKKDDPIFKRLTLSDAGKDYGRGLYLVLGFKAMQSFHLPVSNPEKTGKVDEFLDSVLNEAAGALPH